MSSIKFPEGFIGLKKYPGYFWNLNDKRLYSIKVSGVLRPLAKQSPSSFLFRKYGWPLDEYYYISFRGRSKILFISEINRLLDHNYEIPQKND